MEGILAIAAIIIVIVRLVNASQGKQNNQQQTQQPQRPVMKDFDFGEQFKRFEEMLSPQPKENSSYEGINRPNSEGYKQEKPPVKNDMRYNKYPESQEGTESQEGKCIEPNPNHCAVEHPEDSVYATEITDQQEFCFTREDIVNGVIMAEILSKPKCME